MLTCPSLVVPSHTDAAAANSPMHTASTAITHAPMLLMTLRFRTKDDKRTNRRRCAIHRQYQHRRSRTRAWVGLDGPSNPSRDESLIYWDRKETGLCNKVHSIANRVANKHTQPAGSI